MENTETTTTDIRSAFTKSALVAPEEAAKNIDRAALFDVSPDSYAGLKDHLEPDAIAVERVPASIEPETKKFLTQSEQHASLASEDIDKMNVFESRAKYLYEKTIEMPKLDREINEIVSKKFDTPDGKLEDGDEEMLKDLRSLKREMEDKHTKYGLSDTEKFAGDVATAIGDFGRSYWENKKLLAGSIGTGAVIGTGVGAATPVPGAALLGMTAGAAKGAVAGSLLVGFVDSYNQTSASVYDELDSSDTNLPHDRKVNVSRAVGVLSGVAGGLAGKVFASSNSFIKRLANPKAAAKIIANPAMAAKLDILGGVAKSVLAEGGEEAFQEFVQTVGTTFGKMDESEASFVNALEEATSSENLKKYVHAGTVGGVTGGVIQTVTSAPAYGKVKSDIEKKNEITRRKQEILETQNNLVELANDMKDSKISQVAPQEMTKWQKMIFGEDSVFFNLDDLREFSNSPEKGAAVRKIIDPSGELTKMAQELNTPIKVSKADLMQVITEFPEITDYMRLTPDGENPLSVRDEGREFAAKLDEADKRREELLSSLNEPAWKKEGYTLEVEEINQGYNDEWVVTAKDKEGNKVGNYTFSAREERLGENEIAAVQPSTKEAHQKKGLASAAYDLIEKTTGKKVQPSSEENLTEAGKALWNSRNRNKNLLEQLQKDITEPVKFSRYFSDREAYLDLAAIQPIEGVVTPKDAEDLSRAQLEARLEIDKSLVAPIDKRFERNAEAEFKNETAGEIENEINKLKKEYDIIDNFARTKELNDIDTEVVKSHKKKGFSAFAIDPNSLSVSQRAMYYDNNGLTPSMKKNIKDRKVFVEGGLDLESAAIINGLESGDQLLKILAETPTKKQIENRIKNDPLRNATRPEMIADSMEDAKLAARDQAFTKLTKAHLKEMQFMVSKEWPTVKRGIIKIARKPPTIEALQTRAQDTIKKMKIRDINPNVFKQGESRSQKGALDHFLKGEFEQAFDMKERAALNNELRKEALKIQSKVEKFQNFWKRMSNESNVQELKDAGMYKVMEEYMSLYKLDGNIKGETEQKAFNSWVKQQVEDGKFVPVVPDRLDNTQASFKDLTVEQYQTMTEMGEFILHQAKLKNKLLQEAETRAELRTAETIQEEIEELTKANVNYDPDRAESQNANTLSITDTWKQGTKTAASVFSSIKTIATELDEYKLGGFFYRTIVKPIKDARTAKRLETKLFTDRDKKLVEEFYGDKFAEVYNFVHVPEFADIPSLGDRKGNIRKSDLLVLQAYMGDPNARESIPNFVNRAGEQVLDVDVVQRILDTHLDEKDVAFVQNFLNDRFKPLEQRSFDLHKRTTGIEPEMIKGVPFVHRGKVYPGGYYPIKRQRLPDEVRAARAQADIEGKDTELGLGDEGEFFARMRSSEMTQQGRLKERTGSQRPLDLNFENFITFTEEALHDLHFREAGIDVLKVLKNPINVQNMKAVIGPQKYSALIDGVKDTVSKSSERDSTVLFNEKLAWINGWIDKGHSVHAIKTIGFNVASAAIQPTSLTNLLMRVGPETGVYLTKMAAKINANIMDYPEFIQMAGEINPDILLEKDNVDNALIKGSYDWLPASTAFFKKWPNTSGSAISKIRGMQKKAVEMSFMPVREVDRGIKVLTTLALSAQFFDGKIPGWDLAKIEAMSDAEKAQTLRLIVQQSSDLSLTASATEDRSPIEKHKVTGVFTRYFTDRRAGLNTILAQVDKISGSVKRKENAQAAKHLMTLSIATGISAAFIAAVRNEEESIIKKLKESKDGEDYLDVFTDTMWDFAKAPVDQTLGSIPFVDAIKYAAGSKQRSDYRNVSTPLMAVGSDIASGLVIMDEILSMAMKGKMMKLNEKQLKILLTDFGYIAGGMPTNTMFKAASVLSARPVTKNAKELSEDVKSLHKKIDKFIDTFKDDKEAQPFIDDLKEYKKSLPQFDADVKNIIPENTKETLKAALSGGKWNKFDPETRAAGIYQFTEERWKELMSIAPNLGLTENGRIAKDPAQQERAMNWVIQDNTRGLLTYEIPVTEANLLGAHKFGFDNFVAIYESGNNEKLSVALGDEYKNPVFKNFKTVGEIKSYLDREARKGK